MVYRFLRDALGERARVIAGGSALVFMCCPLHFQVVLWPSTVSASIGAGVLLALATRLLRGPMHAVTLFVGVCAIACLYEQPAAAALALPVLAARGGGDARRRVRTTVVAAISIVAALAVYAVLLRLTAPDFARGGASSLADLTSLPSRLGETVGGTIDALAGRRTIDLLRGSWIQAWYNLTNPMGIAMLAALTGLLLYWSVGVGARAAVDRSDRASASSCVGEMKIVLFGLAIIACSLLPGAMVESQRVQHRLLYVPLLGGVITCAAVAQVLARLTGRISAHWVRGALAGVCAMAASAACIAGCICLVGFQSLYQNRWRLDERQLAQLRECAPELPPGSVLVPLRLQDQAAGTGVESFDGFPRSVFETGWTARAAARRAFACADVWSTHVPMARDGVAKALGEFDELSARYRPTPTIYEKLLSRRENLWDDDDADRGVRVPFDRMLPFITTRRGDVELVSRLRVNGREIRFPLVEEAIRRAAEEGRRVRHETVEFGSRE
jgi:hypothetical protein